MQISKQFCCNRASHLWGHSSVEILYTPNKFLQIKSTVSQLFLVTVQFYLRRKILFPRCTVQTLYTRLGHDSTVYSLHSLQIWTPTQ